MHRSHSHDASPSNAIPCVKFKVFDTVQACKEWEEITFSPTQLSAYRGDGSYTDTHKYAMVRETHEAELSSQ